MRISGTKPSSVILSQTKKFQNLKKDDQLQNVPKQDKAKIDGVINPQNYIFNQFKHRKFEYILVNTHDIQNCEWFLRKSSVCDTKIHFPGSYVFFFGTFELLSLAKDH